MFEARALAQRLVFNLLAANGLGLAFLPLLGAFAWLDGAIVGVAMLLVYLIARLWGTLLPSLAHLGVAADARSGFRTGVLYLTNIGGAAAGSIITGSMIGRRIPGTFGIGRGRIAVSYGLI